MKAIAYSNPDGSVAIIHLAPQANVVNDFLRAGNPTMAATIRAMTYDQFVDWVRTKDMPAGAANVQIIDTTAIPDRSTRSAWRLT
mgnify:CR=1 FL=1